jgi:hypothetical protein
MARVSLNLSDDGFTRVSAETARAIVKEPLDVGIMPLVIIRQADQIRELPPGVHVEMGNEPDLSKFGWTVDSYRRELDRAVAVAQDHGVHLWAGAVSNLNQRGFKFLRQLPWCDLPAWVGCSVHRYPDGPPDRGHVKGGFLVRSRYTREEEVAELRAIVGARPVGLSEIGYNHRDFSEDQAARHLAWEARFFAQQDFTFAIAYQINSEHPTEGHHDAHFGFRRHESEWETKGVWRPCADAWFGCDLAG